MTPATGETAIFRFSTDHLPQHERAGAVREMHERCTLAFKPEPMEALSGQAVRVDIAQWALPGLGMMSGALCGLRQHIRPQCSAPTGADDVFLALNIAGACVVTRRGDQVMVRDGDAFLATRGAKGFTVARPGRARFIGLRLPVRTLSPLVPDLDDSEVHVIPNGTAALKLLRKYLNLIAHESTLTTVELQRVAVSHVYDLAAVTLGATADRAQLARDRGVRAARLEVIKADIIAHVDDGRLSSAAVAARHAMTLRYLQKLFEAAGTTFSEFVLDQRLTNAYRALTNSLSPRPTISQIAYGTGFNDLSYFNRAFRRRYGSTPSEVRHGQ
jgi:AraC-like DNA-binding protein